MTPKDNSFHTHHTTNRSLRSVQVPPPPKEHSPQYSAHICCGQMAWWIKMPLGRRVGFDPSDIVWGSSYPSPKGGRAPQFSAHVYCGQTAAWIKMLLGMEIGLGPGHIVLYGDPAPLPKKRRHSPQFSAYVYCGQTAAWINMQLGMEVGLDPSDIVSERDPCHIVLDGDPAPPPP